MLVREGVPLATVASRCGYADQSHLTREWVVLAGCGPTEVEAGWSSHPFKTRTSRTHQSEVMDITDINTGRP